MNKQRDPEVRTAGDSAVLVVFGDEISRELYGRVRALAAALTRDAVEGIGELVPSYAALMIHFDTLTLSLDQVREIVLARTDQPPQPENGEYRLRVLPTVFGGAYGPDLPDSARRLGLSEEDLIRLFTEATYTVYMLGHTPGNPYMGGLPPRLALPRLERPRERVPAGTVALAHQATVYPFTAPGGWRWLGRTSVKLFDPTQDPPNHLDADDRVRFAPVSEGEYLELGGEKCP